MTVADVANSDFKSKTPVFASEQRAHVKRVASAKLQKNSEKIGIKETVGIAYTLVHLLHKKSRQFWNSILSLALKSFTSKLYYKDQNHEN